MTIRIPTLALILTTFVGVLNANDAAAQSTALRSPEILPDKRATFRLAAPKAHEVLLQDGIRSRVVSMPSWELFDEQPAEYRDAVLPPSVTARIAVEQGAALGWERYVGAKGRMIGMRSFGASAPIADLQRHFGFTPEAIVTAAMELLGRSDRALPEARRS